MELTRLSSTARGAVRAGDWATVRRCATTILESNKNDGEGYFLYGLAQSGDGQPAKAIRSFRNAIEADGNRYDAAIELMRQLVKDWRYADAFDLFRQYEGRLQNSPYYLEVAAATLTEMGLHDRALALYARAAELQPEVDRFRESLATCSVLVGKVDEAKSLFRQLIAKYPQHQRNHYELAKLATATDDDHAKQMKTILDAAPQSHERNIFLYYALGKELEDLGRWDESFDYLMLGGDAAKKSSGYEVRADLQLIDTIIETCTAAWLAAGESDGERNVSGKTPIFIVGLPRTGTTLVERILASHSAVQSVDETHFIEMSLKVCTGIASRESVNKEIVKAAAAGAADCVEDTYMEFLNYRLGSEAYFIDKYPENFSCAGFIARSFPQAKIVHVTRHPMDACFAMYKQSYFRYAYSLADLGSYYLGYRRLRDHWDSILGDRIINVAYESLVMDQERQTRQLLESIGLPFEEGCLRFHENTAPSATASTVQVREKIHSRSVGRWKHYAKQLEPLRSRLEAAGIDVA